MLAVNLIHMFSSVEYRQNNLPERDKQCDDNWECHLNIMEWGESNPDQNQQLNDFNHGEDVNLFLWNSSDVMGWWIRFLFRED